MCYVVANTTTFRQRLLNYTGYQSSGVLHSMNYTGYQSSGELHSMNYTGYQSSGVLHSKLRLLLSTLSVKISHPTCVIFCVTMRHLAVCVRPLRIFYVSSAANCYQLTYIQTRRRWHSWNSFPSLIHHCNSLCTLNLNLKRTYLNELSLTVHTSHVVVIAPTNSFELHTARYKFYLLIYDLSFTRRHNGASTITFNNKNDSECAQLTVLTGIYGDQTLQHT